MKTLVSIQFNSGRIEYDENFQITVIGKLYPRQFDAANEMLVIYKQCTRLDKNEPEHKP